MPATRARHATLILAAVLPLLWAFAAVVDRRGPPPADPALPRVAPQALALAPPPPDAAPQQAIRGAVVRLFEATLDFVQEIARSFERRDYMGAVVRLLVIVEVLLGGIGVVTYMSVWDEGRAKLVYRIVDVMGALFLVIALLLFGKTFA